MNRAHDGVFFLSSFKNEKETSKFNYVAMGALEGALVNVIEAAEQILGPFFMLCNGGADRRSRGARKNFRAFFKDGRPGGEIYEICHEAQPSGIFHIFHERPVCTMYR